MLTNTTTFAAALADGGHGLSTRPGPANADHVDGVPTSTAPMSPPRRRMLRRLLMGVLVPLALVVGTSASAEAATITRSSSFECGYHSATVYFPELRTTSGNETIHFSPDLYKYTSSGWMLVRGDAPKRWYRSTVGIQGIYTINGYKWFINQTPFRNVTFASLTPGYYAVMGSFYGGSSHWANVYGNAATSCYVS
jgi:hypothetical protein